MCECLPTPTVLLIIVIERKIFAIHKVLWMERLKSEDEKLQSLVDDGGLIVLLTLLAQVTNGQGKARDFKFIP